MEIASSMEFLQDFIFSQRKSARYINGPQIMQAAVLKCSSIAILITSCAEVKYSIPDKKAILFEPKIFRARQNIVKPEKNIIIKPIDLNTKIGVIHALINSAEATKTTIWKMLTPNSA